MFSEIIRKYEKNAYSLLFFCQAENSKFRSSNTTPLFMIKINIDELVLKNFLQFDKKKHVFDF
jgi:hypothetical protein